MEDELSAYNADDHRKFTYALFSRDIRRLTAKIHHANIDDETQKMVDAALDQLETRVWVMSFHDPASSRLIQNQDRYADGRPVATTISWGEGYATLVHSPDPNVATGVGVEELSEEAWPSGPDEPPCNPLDMGPEEDEE
ncbi:hypothetical protein A5712_00340 [Mycobacterium sp. E2327]|uniref:hypothetical protein n=1 Tax=Mycobacterium sp. E2327 TaxID=1834132 RepID=UPI000801AAA5|nr:hypothetical protein [Mycobacterium sp. E2327]OBI18301.1 hypothetical protein A5712_00340 [Mycobacterium sp. E2327]